MKKNELFSNSTADISISYTSFTILKSMRLNYSQGSALLVSGSALPSGQSIENVLENPLVSPGYAGSKIKWPLYHPIPLSLML